MNHKVVLVVMDGWGEAPPSAGNAVSVANTPFIDSLYKKYPHCHLLTSGEHVGLPDGQMGNSEVGHLNLGAGRVVYQELAMINKAIREKSIDQVPVLQNVFSYCNGHNKDLHFIGLVSDGGVHSHLKHLEYLCKLAHQYKVERVYIHVFTDGRDTDPGSGLGFVNELESEIKSTGAKIASVVGRYYAMDRDKRWERIRKAYDLLVHGVGEKFNSASEGIEKSYSNKVTDEFINPISIHENGQPIALIKEGDAVISFNFRTDRCREITHVLTQQDMPDYRMKRMNLHYVTLTSYDHSFKDVHVVYDKDNLKNTIGEVIANAGKKQLRVAETEKYPHVTFFFSGGREAVFDGEERVMIQSPKVATYDLKPSMSAEEVKEAMINEIRKNKFDFICLNFANADMVGHTGVFNAVIEAVETVDRCVGEIVHEGLLNGYTFLITADHGNADKMVNDDGSPNTAHTTNPVPCFLITPQQDKINLLSGNLADIAPTILQLMGIAIPRQMSGTTLIG